MLVWCQNFFQKTNEIFSRISALASKKRSNQKCTARESKQNHPIRCIKCRYFFDLTSFLEARAEILTKNSLVFGSIWGHQKDISKITCLNKGQKRPCIDCWVQLQVINSYLSFSTQTNPLSVPLIVQRELKFPQLPDELFSPYLWYMKITFLPSFTFFIWNALYHAKYQGCLLFINLPENTILSGSPLG